MKCIYKKTPHVTLLKTSHKHEEYVACITTSSKGKDKTLTKVTT